MQESGRAGRGGQPSRATLYFNKSDIAANRPGMTDETRRYCKSDDLCLRLLLVKHLHVLFVCLSNTMKKSILRINFVFFINL